MLNRIIMGGAWTYGTGDKGFDWKVLLCEIIWRLQVQSQQQVRVTKNPYYNLTLNRKTREEGRRSYRPKRSDYNSKDEV